MAFSTAQYQAVTSKLTSGVSDIGAKIPDLTSAANSVTSKWYVPELVKEAVVWLTEKIVSIAEWMYHKILDLLKGAAAPVLMFNDAWNWQSIRGEADTVAAGLTPQAVSISNDWQGTAATAYAGAVAGQSAAAARIASIADATATSLTVCAAAGLAFYVAIGIIVVKFLIAMTAAIAALSSVVFSWAGLALIAEEAGVNTGLIIGAVAALTTLLGAQATQMVALHGQAADPSAFPGGHWPTAVRA